MIDSNFVGTVGTVGAQNVYPEKKDTFSKITTPRYYRGATGTLHVQVAGRKITWVSMMREGNSSDYGYRVFRLGGPESVDEYTAHLLPSSEEEFKTALRELVEFMKKIEERI